MPVNGSFHVERKFWDDINFPYGFSRSGEFTVDQATLLESHGYAYLLLAKGERKPVDSLEENFVAFCNGQKEAENSHEKTWKRYLDKLNNQAGRYSLTRAESRYAADESSESFDSDD